MSNNAKINKRINRSRLKNILFIILCISLQKYMAERLILLEKVNVVSQCSLDSDMFIYLDHKFCKVHTSWNSRISY